MLVFDIRDGCPLQGREAFPIRPPGMPGKEQQ